MDPHQWRTAPARSADLWGGVTGGGRGTGRGRGVVEARGSTAGEESAGVGPAYHTVHFGLAVAGGVEGGGADVVTEDNGEVFFCVDGVLVEVEEDFSAGCAGRYVRFYCKLAITPRTTKSKELLSETPAIKTRQNPPSRDTHVGILALTIQFTSGSSFSSFGCLPDTSGTPSTGVPGVVGGVNAGLRIDGGTSSPNASDSLLDIGCDVCGESVGDACAWSAGK